MNEQELEEIERRAREAQARAEQTPPGPWSILDGYTGPNYASASRIGPRDSYPDGLIVYGNRISGTIGTLEFIAAARQDVPALAADALRLLGELREAQAERDAKHGASVRNSKAACDALDVLTKTEAQLAAVTAERDRYAAALDKLGDAGNYTVEGDGDIYWNVINDPEYRPWEFARRARQEGGE